MLQIYRHGDVLIREVKKLPKGLKIKKNNILALGEATGHNHKLSGSVVTYADDNNKVYFEVEKEVGILTHQEHKKLEILPGKYEVVIEREYSYFDEEINRVVD